MEKTKAKFLAADIAECSLFTALMVAGAFIRIPTPLIPLTFQTVIGVLAGLLLGAKKGAISMAVYCFMGLIGIPVFTDGGGIFYVVKPTFGYVIGFILSAAIAGTTVKPDSGIKRYLVAAVLAFLADYAVGIPYCIVAAHFSGVGNLLKLFITGNLIYMPKDLVLCILAAVIARHVRPVLRNFR